MIADVTPDAVYVSGALRRGATMPERLASVLAIAEPLLGVDRARGERGWVRKLESGNPQRPEMWLFISKSADDQLLFPLAMDGPLRGRPQYDWVDGPQGIKFGYLVPAARDAGPAPSRPPGT